MKPKILTGSNIQVLRNYKTGKPIRSPYLRAANLVTREGLMLPSIYDHDKLLFDTVSGKAAAGIAWRRKRELVRGQKGERYVGYDSLLYLDITLGIVDLNHYYNSWSREILVLPAKGKMFNSSSGLYDGETGWVFLRRNIPKEVFDLPHAGLLVDPEHFEPSSFYGRDTLIVHPKKITILCDVARGYGKLDPETGFPKLISKEERIAMGIENKYPQLHDDVRRLLIPNEDIVSPFARGMWITSPCSDGRHDIMVADYLADFGVGGVPII